MTTQVHYCILLLVVFTVLQDTLSITNKKKHKHLQFEPKDFFNGVLYEYEQQKFKSKEFKSKTSAIKISKCVSKFNPFSLLKDCLGRTVIDNLSEFKSNKNYNLEFLKILIKDPQIFGRFEDIYNSCKGSTADEIAKLDWLRLDLTIKENKNKMASEPPQIQPQPEQQLQKKKKGVFKKVMSSVKNAGQTYQTKIGMEDKWDNVIDVIKKLSHTIHHIDNKYYSFARSFKRIFSLKENTKSGRVADMIFCSLFSSKKVRNIGKPGNQGYYTFDECMEVLDVKDQIEFDLEDVNDEMPLGDLGKGQEDL